MKQITLIHKYYKETNTYRSKTKHTKDTKNINFVSEINPITNNTDLQNKTCIIITN